MQWVNDELTFGNKLAVYFLILSGFAFWFMLILSLIVAFYSYTSLGL